MGDFLPSLTEARAVLDHATGRGTRIAILDSGVDITHPAMSGTALAEDVIMRHDGLDWRTDPGDGSDLFGHGTAIAWLIRGIAPDADLCSYRVLGEGLSGKNAAIRAAAQAAMDRGCRVLNCSFGCRAGAASVMLYKGWTDAAYLRGCHVVAASCNEDLTRPEWPAHFPTILSVALSEEPGLSLRKGTLVEFAAPGVNVRVPWLSGGWKHVTGSSYAAAVVSGLTARLVSAFPDLSVPAMKTLLLRLAAG